MEEKRLLDEYVLSDVGKVWVGPYRSSRGREWVFGQFDAVVLPACMLVLSRSRVHPASRGDPIQVTRALSKMVRKPTEQFTLLFFQENTTYNFSEMSPENKNSKRTHLNTRTSQFVYPYDFKRVEPASPITLLGYI